MPDRPTINARPEFLRRGTPILIPVSKRVRTIGRLALCQGIAIDSNAVRAYTDDGPEWVPLSEVEVDLSDATGRAHVAWALALHFIINVDRHDGAAWIFFSPCTWGVFAGSSTTMFRGSPDRRVRPPPLVVPTLSTLDPTDDTRLPDGSRLVEALALKLVAEHVFGGSDV